MKTIVDLIADLDNAPQSKVFVYDRRGQSNEECSYAELCGRARAVGAHYLEQGFEPGEYVFLQLTNSIELIEGFLGAIIVGLIPCCLASPRSLGGTKGFRERMHSLARSFPDSRLIAHEDVGKMAGIPYSTPLDVATIDLTQGDALAPLILADPNSLAFVQLTSGSTHRPKAVRISHRALMSNAKNICAGLTRGADSVVSWLPLYHDMGLVGCLLCPLYLHIDIHLMQPETFLTRPEMWLRRISDIPGPSISNAPNSAYQSCVQRIRDAEVEKLDLSRWRIAGSGAERVRAETLAAFADHFAPAGFRSDAFVPCYGLAETTLAVTYGYGGTVPNIDAGHVSCGRPISETEVEIRDAKGNVLAEGEAGEITVRSESLFSGYAGHDDHPSPIQDGWLRTGDRGYLKDGELYVTGRYKDLIIVDGVNYDPDEFEFIGESTVEINGARSGAFSLELDGRERTVLVNEITPQSDDVYEELSRRVGTRMAELFGFRIYDVRFVRRGSLPKTSSGKVRRAKLRSLYENDELETLWRQRS